MEDGWIERYISHKKRDKSEYSVFNFCNQWVEPSDKVSDDCWISPSGDIYSCSFGNHSQVMAVLIVDKIAQDINSEREAELKGWIKKSFGKYQISVFPVKKRIFDLILEETSEVGEVYINGKYFINVLRGILEEYLERGIK